MGASDTGEKEGENRKVNPNPLPITLIYITKTDKPKTASPNTMSAMPTRFGTCNIDVSEEKLTIPKPNFSFR
jgi:hypothetical protein